MRVCLVLVLVAAACGGPRRSDDLKVRDQEIKRDIMMSLRGDERFVDIRVTCEKGVVTLDGAVLDQAENERAQSLAWDVSGVEEVRSRLRHRSR